MTTTKTTTKPAEKSAEDAFATGNKVVEQVVKASTDAYEQAMSSTKDQVDKFIPQVMKGYEEVATMNKANVDAMMKASNTFAKGFEDIGKSYFNFAQASAEAGAEAAKEMMGAKTLKEVLDIQTKFARSSFDSLVAEGTKLNEMTIKVTNEAFAPIQTQFNASVEKSMKPAA